METITQSAKETNHAAGGVVVVATRTRNGHVAGTTATGTEIRVDVKMTMMAKGIAKDQGIATVVENLL